MTREQTLRHALLVTSGVLSALMAGRLMCDESTDVTFTGDFAHLGTVTLGEALDMADAALADKDGDPT